MCIRDSTGTVFAVLHVVVWDCALAEVAASISAQTTIHRVWLMFPPGRAATSLMDEGTPTRVESPTSSPTCTPERRGIPHRDRAHTRDRSSTRSADTPRRSWVGVG